MDTLEDTQRTAFLAELRALLTKYDVRISAGVGDHSDTHGIHDEHITIERRLIPGRFKEVEWLRVDGWSLTPRDIDDAKEN